MNARARVVVLLSVAALSAAPATAQVTASIHGSVTDETRSVLPNVTITVMNTETNEKRSTITNAAGAYSLPELALGTYSVRAELAGFKPVTRDGVQLSLNRNARIDF